MKTHLGDRLPEHHFSEANPACFRRFRVENAPGESLDEETGLDYFGARYYAPWLGRWTSADPLGIGADGPGLYNYVRGSPVVLHDPNGTEGMHDSRTGTGEYILRHAEGDTAEPSRIRKGAEKGALRFAAALAEGAALANAPLLTPPQSIVDTHKALDEAIEEAYPGITPGEELLGGAILNLAGLVVGAAFGSGTLVESAVTAETQAAKAAEATAARGAAPGLPRSVGAAAATEEAKAGEALYDSLPEDVKYRVLARDVKGRPFGSPANPRVPTAQELNANVVDVPASELKGTFTDTKHGLFPEQLAAVRQLSNEELLTFRAADPISVGHTPTGGLLTGGHHRTAVILERLASGQLSAEDIVKVLFHD